MIATSFEKQENHLQVVITGAKNLKGHILISLFNNSNGFPDHSKSAIQNLSVQVQKNTIVTFNDLPEGEYAIAVLHDENDDLKLNTNWIGIPKEGFGFSNNVMGLFGPPSFTKAKMHYQGGSKKTEIHLKYF